MADTEMKDASKATEEKKTEDKKEEPSDLFFGKYNHSDWPVPFRVEEIPRYPWEGRQR